VSNTKSKNKWPGVGRITQLQLQIIFHDLAPVWEEFLPYVQKCWQLQRECESAGNCRSWWKSRFYDFYIGHGHGKSVRRDFETMEKFPEFWQQYGHLLQQNGRRSA